MHLGAVGVALGKASLAKLFEIGKAIVFPLGQLEAREKIMPELKVEIAHLGNFHGVVRRVLKIREQSAHLLLALQVKLLRFKAHTVGVIHGFAHLDAHQNILIICVLFLYIMRVICQHKGYARFAVERNQLARGLFLVKNAVILYFQVEIALAEQLIKLQGASASAHIVPVDELLRDFARETAGKANKPLGVLVQKLPIYPRLCVKPLGKRRRHKVAKVFVPRFVFAQQNKVGVVPVHNMLAVAHSSRGNVDFAADNRLYARFLAGLIKRHSAVHHAVIRHGERRLPQLRRLFGDFIYPASPVKQGVLRMNVQMNKAHLLFLPLLSLVLLFRYKAHDFPEPVAQAAFCHRGI